MVVVPVLDSHADRFAEAHGVLNVKAVERDFTRPVRPARHRSAMAAGITDHRWCLWELLWHRVPDVTPVLSVPSVPSVRAPAPVSKLFTPPLPTERVLAA